MRLFPAVLALALCLVPAQGRCADAGESTELWEGKVLSATFAAGICTKPGGAVRGVFLLTHRSGDTDVYHVYGYRDGNMVEVRHPSGHVFRAEVAPDGTLEGRARIKNRISLTLKGRSTPGVPLSDDCAPLK